MPSTVAPAMDDMAKAQTDGPTAAIELEGRIVGLDQQPLAGIAVSLCQQTCRDTMTGAQGEFAFAGVMPEFYTLRARTPTAGDYAELDFPIYLNSGSNPLLGPLVLPRVGAGAAVPAGPQPFPVDAALTLSIDGSALTFPPGVPTGRLGGVRIPKNLFPDFCVPSARVVAMWAFNPSGIGSTAGIGVELSDTLGLSPGAQVTFIAIDPSTGRPWISASGSVSQDGKIIHTTTGDGLHVLSWLLVAVLQGGA